MKTQTKIDNLKANPSKRKITTLTDKGVRALKPDPDKPLELAIAGSAGLRLRITQGGVKSFVFSYAHPQTGKMKRIRMGTYPSMTVAMANAEYHRLKGIRQAKKDPQAHERARAAEIAQEEPTEEDDLTVAGLVKLYIDAVSGGKRFGRGRVDYKRSWREEKRVLEKELIPFYGNLPARDLTEDMVQELVDNKMVTGKGRTMSNGQGNKAAVRAMVAVIRLLYNRAIQVYRKTPNPFPPNPALDIDMGQAPESRERVLIDSELAKVMKNLPAVTVGGDLLEFVLLTGVRISEGAGMRWDELIDDDVWRIPSDRMKHRKEHVVYLSRQAQAIIQRQPKDSDYVWPSTRGNTNHVQVAVIHHALKRVDFGIQRWTIHDFRRSLSTWLGENGASMEVNDRMLAHITAGAVHRIYNRATTNKPAREWWQKWADHLEALRNG